MSCSDDKSLIVWDLKGMKGNKKSAGKNNGLETPKNVCTISGIHTRTIYSVDWSQNGLIATGSGDDNIRVFAEVCGKSLGKIEWFRKHQIHGSW